MIYKTQITVRGYHIDLYDHVNNGRYLEFLEEARWDMFEQSIDRKAWHKKGRGLSVVNININYRHPAQMGDRLEIQTRLVRIGNKSVTLHQTIILEGTENTVVDAAVTFVVINMQTGKAEEICGDILDEIKKLK